MSTHSLCSSVSISVNTVHTALLQGEEGPPSLEYIQAKDLFPQKELVKEDDSLQVSSSFSCQVDIATIFPGYHARL